MKEKKERIDRHEFAKLVGKKVDLPKYKMEEILQAYEDVVYETLRDGVDIHLVGFLTFTSEDIPAKECRDMKKNDGTYYMAEPTRKAKVIKRNNLFNCVK